MELVLSPAREVVLVCCILKSHSLNVFYCWQRITSV